MRHSTQRFLHSTIFIILILGSLLVFAGCSPGGLFSGDLMYAPHRQQEIGPDTLQDALTALSEGDRAGEIVLTEEEFSSLMNTFFVNEDDDENALKGLQIWFEPDTVIMKLLMTEGAIPGIPSDVAINLEGNLRTEDGRLRLDLERGGVGVFASLSPILRDFLEAEMERQIGILFDRTSPLDVKVDTGSMTITLPEY